MQVDAKGATILAGFEDGVMRVLNLQQKQSDDEYGRKQKEEQNELFLRLACKPHSKRVTCIAVDSKGEILATGVR